MPARASGKRFLRLSLVAIGADLHNVVASRSAICFQQIHTSRPVAASPTWVVRGIGKVENTDIAKGYEAKGYEVDAETHVLLEPEEIDAIKLEKFSPHSVHWFTVHNRDQYSRTVCVRGRKLSAGGRTEVTG
jgi:DNA end-binding protein Ku